MYIVKLRILKWALWSLKHSSFPHLIVGQPTVGGVVLQFYLQVQRQGLELCVRYSEKAKNFIPGDAYHGGVRWAKIRLIDWWSWVTIDTGTRYLGGTDDFRCLRAQKTAWGEKMKSDNSSAADQQKPF